MIKPEKMARVRIIGLRAQVEGVIRELHLLGTIQIEDLSKEMEKFEGALELDVPLEKFDAVSKQLVKLRGMESVLPKAKKTAEEKIRAGEALEKAAELDEKTLFEWHSELWEVLKQSDALKNELESVKKLGVFEIDFSKLEDARLSFFVGMLSRKALSDAEKKLKKLKNCELIAKKISKNDVGAILAVENAHAGEALQILSSVGFDRLAVPQGMRRPSTRLAELHAQVHGLEKRRIELEAKMREFSENNSGKIIGLMKALETESERAEITTNFGRSRNLFVLEGWVRERELGKLKHHLKQATGNKVLIEKITSKELAPTSLHNPSMVANFEDLATFVSLPKSNEFDPTIFYAFTFPMMYGLMLGDVAYGAIILLLGLVGWLKASGIVKRFSAVLVPCGIWSIVWGAIFGEVLGFEFHSVISRVENVPLLLGLTIVVGVLHLILGFAAGFFKEFGHRNMKHAAAKLAWIGVIIALGLIAATPLPYVGGVLAAASIIVIGWSEGIVGLVEIPGLIGNILSYMRLAAVGLASIALAVILNQFKPELSMGWVAIPLALLFVVGHAFNLLLGVFEPFVQGSRLHFVEFYTKFYEGGGKPFAPFHVRK